MTSGKCCSYVSIEFTVRKIIGRKNTIAVDILHADNELYFLPDQVCKGIKAPAAAVSHKDSRNGVCVTVAHCIKCSTFMKLLFPWTRKSQ